jgi:hypothetical protein
VWTKNFKNSSDEEDDVEMTGDGEGSGEPSRDEDDFEKQIRLVNESDKTTVRVSTSQVQVDQIECRCAVNLRYGRQVPWNFFFIFFSVFPFPSLPPTANLFFETKKKPKND